MALSAAEKSSVVQLVRGGEEAVVEHVRQRATALSSGDGGVRRRSLARAAAVQEALVQELSALLGSAIARRDPAVGMLDRALTSATARYRSLLDQLRSESAPGRRGMVMAKGTVAIAAQGAA